MEVFCHNAVKPREDLESFNHRLSAFCHDNMVVAAKTAMIGPSLIVALTLADDMDIPAANTITLRVVPIDGLADDLEEGLTRVLDRLADDDTEEDPLVPFSLDVVTRSDLPVQGFAVISVVNGLAVDEGLPDGEGGDDEGETD